MKKIKPIRQGPLSASTSSALVLGSLSGLVPLAIDLYLPCFDAMAETFHVRASDVGASMPTFFVGMFLGQLVWGPLSDKYGRRAPLLSGLTLYVLASAACAMAPSLPLLVACRVMQAFGGCTGMVISRAMVRDSFERERAAHMLSMLMLVQGLAPMVGPSLGSALQIGFGWRSVFWVLTGLGALQVAACALMLPETHRSKQRTLTFARAARQYFDVACDRSFLRYALSGSLVSAGLFAYLTCSPFIAMDLLHLSPQTYGFLFSANALALWLCGQLNRYVALRWGSEKTLKFGLRSALLAALLLLIFCAMPLQPVSFFLPLAGFLSSLAFVWPHVQAGALARQGHRAGTAAATQGAIHWGIACIASAVASGWTKGGAIPMAVVIFMAALSANAAFWFIPRVKWVLRDHLGS